MEWDKCLRLSNWGLRKERGEIFSIGHYIIPKS